MAKNKKPKPKKGIKNDNRRNKKAWKKNKYRPRHSTNTLTEADKVLLGGGMLRNVHKRWDKPVN